jgi:hypothetical protein
MPETGTSQLVHVLNSHANVTGFLPLADCAGVPFSFQNQGTPEATQSGLYSYFENLQEQPNEMTISKCYGIPDIILRYRYVEDLKPNGNFIYLFRDPADWMWAIFNRFVDLKLDVTTATNDATTTTTEYRTPELFHEMVQSMDRTHVGLQLLERRNETVTRPRLLLEAFGKDKVLFGRKEDLHPDQVGKEGGILSKLAAMMGIDNKFDEKIMNQGHNCADNIGHENECDFSTSGEYAITGGRGMLPETRRFIYILFHKECKFRISFSSFSVCCCCCVPGVRIVSHGCFSLFSTSNRSNLEDRIRH